VRSPTGAGLNKARGTLLRFASCWLFPLAVCFLIPGPAVNPEGFELGTGGPRRGEGGEGLITAETQRSGRPRFDFYPSRQHVALTPVPVLRMFISAILRYLRPFARKNSRRRSESRRMERRYSFLVAGLRSLSSTSCRNFVMEGQPMFIGDRCPQNQNEPATSHPAPGPPQSRLVHKSPEPRPGDALVTGSRYSLRRSRGFCPLRGVHT
jgi:hypothetical protein